jgi:hypothetical protein
MDELDRYDQDAFDEYEDTTVADIHESIETNMWLAEAYFAKGADGLAREGLRAAWNEHIRFREILAVYSGLALGDKLREMMVFRCVDLLHELDPSPQQTLRGISRRLAAFAA